MYAADGERCWIDQPHWMGLKDMFTSNIKDHNIK